MISPSISSEINRRGITRLCHFAPFRNAHRIFKSRVILCTERLKNEYPESYKPTDEERFDEHEGHICTTIEYPNVWYLAKSEATDDVWIDYLIYLIRPEAMEWDDVLFCKSNAARARGRFCKAGDAAFAALYAREVTGAGVYRREAGHPLWLPTDMQAEVLLPDSVSFDYVTGIVVRSKTEAKRLLAQLRLAQTAVDLPLYVSPGMFSQTALRRLRTGGARPDEERYG